MSSLDSSPSSYYSARSALLSPTRSLTSSAGCEENLLVSPSPTPGDPPRRQGSAISPLFVPATAVEEQQVDHAAPELGSRASPAATGLLSLSTELVVHIARSTACRSDAIAFGQTNKAIMKAVDGEIWRTIALFFVLKKRGAAGSAFSLAEPDKEKLKSALTTKRWLVKEVTFAVEKRKATRALGEDYSPQHVVEYLGKYLSDLQAFGFAGKDDASLAVALGPRLSLFKLQSLTASSAIPSPSFRTLTSPVAHSLTILTLLISSLDLALPDYTSLSSLSTLRLRLFRNDLRLAVVDSSLSVRVSLAPIVGKAGAVLEVDLPNVELKQENPFPRLALVARNAGVRFRLTASKTVLYRRPHDEPDAAMDAVVLRASAPDWDRKEASSPAAKKADRKVAEEWKRGVTVGRGRTERRGKAAPPQDE
ncbi:hypothetical protein JCM10213_008992 [Rhodosporidiobolus nylandii]